MIVFRRRLLFWLFKAYIKRWGKVIIFSFIFGLFVFFLLVVSSRFLGNIIPVNQKTSIGLIGAYKLDNLPPQIVKKLSRGLTAVSKDGTVIPDSARTWEIEENGKKYIFTINDTLRFSDGQKLTSDKIDYKFSDVEIEQPDKKTIVFKLKDAYSPFLITLSQPVFKDGVVGLGEYKVTNVKLNGNFIEFMTLISKKNKLKTETYFFYPSEQALKDAFVLGEIDHAEGLVSDSYKNTAFRLFPNMTVQKDINFNKIVTLFFNTKDKTLSDKKARSGLVYALPDVFTYGQRAIVPYPPHSKYFSGDMITRKEDFAHAKLLLEGSASSSSSLIFTIKTLEKYKNTAIDIKKEWGRLGIRTIIEEVDSIPSDFQIYLGDFNLPKDPDQYVLWHSDQSNNITRFNSKRIDKLLEDGRQTIDIAEREKIYAEFQKYLLDESPAAFLYFPYEIVVTRK